MCRCSIQIHHLLCFKPNTHRHISQKASRGGVMVNKFISLEPLRVSSESDPHCLPFATSKLRLKQQGYITKGAWMLRNG